MTGDLNKWKESEVATPSQVKFFRKGGWFVSRAAAAVGLLVFVVIILLTVLLTKHFTEVRLKADHPGAPAEVVKDPGSTIRPISYELLMNHSSDPFTGDMKVSFKVINDTDRIKLKYSGKVVSLPMVEYADNQDVIRSLNVTSFDYNNENSSVTIIVSKSLLPDTKYTLSLKFEGSTDPEERGVYNITYKVPNNNSAFEERWIMGTNFAPSYCSRVFPCFEDDSSRVLFRVKLLKPANYSSVSNMFQKAVKKVEDFPEAWLDDYIWSPPLPLHSLSYFLLPDYKVRTVKGPSPALNIWYPPHLENITEPLGRLTTSILSYYSGYFRVAIPVPRLSIVVIDGLVSDRPSVLGIIPVSSSLLYSVEEQTSRKEEELFYYLGRKLCNQWFGGLISFRSWSDFWIMEGLALYMADLAASEKLLDYDVMKFISIQEKALHEESYLHPTPFHFLENEDVKIYSIYKGAFVIHMLAETMKPLLFKKGLQDYVGKWKFNVSESTDLWESLNSAAEHVDVPGFVGSWNKDHYPVVNVRYDGTEAQLEQVPGTWWFPVSYMLGVQNEYINAGLMKNETFHIDLRANTSFIVVNPDYSGYYRTNYSFELWSSITNELLNRSKFPSAVKANLIENSFSLAELSELSYEVPLNLSLFLRNETNVIPWLSAIVHIDFIAIFLSESTDLQNFKVYLDDLISSSLASIGSLRGNQVTRKVKRLETELSHWSCKYNLSNECSFGKIYEDWLLSNETLNQKISTDAWKYVICYGVRLNKGNISVENLLSLSRKNMAEPYNELDILKSVTCSSDEDVLRRYLEESLNTSDPYFSPRRTIEMWLSLKEIPENSKIAFQYVKDNWSDIYEKFKVKNEILSAILKGSTSALTEEEDLQEIKEMHELISSNVHMQKVLQNIHEQVQYHVEWKEACLPVVKNWLMKFASTQKSFSRNHMK